MCACMDVLGDLGGCGRRNRNVCIWGSEGVCVCVRVNEHAGVEGVLPIRTHLPLTHPSFSLVLSGKPHYMQVSLAIRERKPKLGSGMQGFLHESERERERRGGWEGVKREGRQRIREGCGLFLY